MKSLIAKACAASAGLLLILLNVFITPTVFAAEAASIEISDGWVRATPPGAEVAAGYMTLHNRSSKAIRLIGIQTSAAQDVQIHEVKTEDGQMKMRHVEEGLLIAPGQSVHISPNGYHLMFMGLAKPMARGAVVPVTLLFDGGLKVVTNLIVREDAPTEDSHAHH